MSRNKPEPVKLGTIGSHDVMQYGDSCCLVVGKTWLSIAKVKAVLANLEACREFLAKHDAPDTALKAATVEKQSLLDQIKALEAKAASLAMSQNGHSKLDTIKA